MRAVDVLETQYFSQNWLFQPHKINFVLLSNRSVEMKRKKSFKQKPFGPKTASEQISETDIEQQHTPALAHGHSNGIKPFSYLILIILYVLKR